MTEEPKAKTVELTGAISRYLETEAYERDTTEDEVLLDMLEDGFYAGWEDIEESVVRLKYISPSTKFDRKIEPLTESGEETETTLKTYRRLRENFPPVSSGIDYHKTFAKGGGFQVDIQDSKSKHQNESRDIINAFNKDIYQDDVVRGLDAILDPILDEALTAGSAAAEIVYEGFRAEGSLNFHEYAKSIPYDKETQPKFESRELDDADWKKLGGIVQLKIIDNAVKRLKPYRNAVTYKIEYWTVDEKQIDAYNTTKSDSEKREVPKLLPWQVWWVPWNARGSRIKGMSMIRPVADIALLLEDILAAIGLSFKKWSDTKYFFILGSDKTGRSWAPPKVRNFLRDVKNMTTSGGTGIPVPAGFDIKEMGGDVFEGGTILDKLTGLITAGMRYPRTFLEQGKSQEGDKAWLAWIVTYSAHQQLLKRTIEHQLWSRHLYAKFGSTTVRIGKQGVKEGDRETVSVYVPRISWTSEGKWHIQQKIEQLTKILNVANPVTGIVKNEIEKDIALTLGYSDLDFGKIDKLIEQQQKLALEESKIEEIKNKILLLAFEKMEKDGTWKEMVPMLQGLSPKKEEVEDKRPPPVPASRLKGGVSRSTKVTGEQTGKGVARPQGGTRQPKIKVAETEERMIQFETYEEYWRTLLTIQEQEAKSQFYDKLISAIDTVGLVGE